MKKARYAFAAVGAVPALGLIAPAATAAPVATHAPVRPAKTVKLTHPATAAFTASASTSPGTSVSPPASSPAGSALHTCHPGTEAGKWSANHNFLFRIIHYGHCVNSQQGLLDVAQPDLTERIRAYSRYGKMTFQRRVHGREEKSYTVFPNSFFSPLNWNPVYNICGALVLNNTNSVYYGPVCIQP